MTFFCIFFTGVKYVTTLKQLLKTFKMFTWLSDFNNDLFEDSFDAGIILGTLNTLAFDWNKNLESYTVVFFPKSC